MAYLVIYKPTRCTISFLEKIKFLLIEERVFLSKPPREVVTILLWAKLELVMRSLAQKKEKWHLLLIILQDCLEIKIILLKDSKRISWVAKTQGMVRNNILKMSLIDNLVETMWII